MEKIKKEKIGKGKGREIEGIEGRKKGGRYQIKGIKREVE